MAAKNSDERRIAQPSAIHVDGLEVQVWILLRPILAAPIYRPYASYHGLPRRRETTAGEG